MFQYRCITSLFCSSFVTQGMLSAASFSTWPHIVRYHISPPPHIMWRRPWQHEHTTTAKDLISSSTRSLTNQLPLVPVFDKITPCLVASSAQQALKSCCYFLFRFCILSCRFWQVLWQRPQVEFRQLEFEMGFEELSVWPFFTPQMVYSIIKFFLLLWQKKNFISEESE